MTRKGGRLAGPPLGASTPPRRRGASRPGTRIRPWKWALIAALSENWPDYASSLGRFTPLRRGGLLGQTFEIGVLAADQRRDRHVPARETGRPGAAPATTSISKVWPSSPPARSGVKRPSELA